MTDYYRANRGFAATVDGEQVTIPAGERVHKSHQLLTGRMNLFTPAATFHGRQGLASRSAPRRPEPPATEAQIRRELRARERLILQDDDAGRAIRTGEGEGPLLRRARETREFWEREDRRNGIYDTGQADADNEFLDEVARLGWIETSIDLHEIDRQWDGQLDEGGR